MFILKCILYSVPAGSNVTSSRSVVNTVAHNTASLRDRRSIDFSCRKQHISVTPSSVANDRRRTPRLFENRTESIRVFYYDPVRRPERCTPRFKTRVSTHISAFFLMNSVNDIVITACACVYPNCLRVAPSHRR